MQSFKSKQTFTKGLLGWFENNDRPLPWKGEKNPYYVWLSEIILQQTRVAQGLPYFEKFKETFPSITDLANASEDQVLKLWQGLGYYSRARNLHATAKYIAYQLDGVFPNTYQEILALKGVGPYTAAAIASFAFDLPHAVVDGNVYRVLSRYFGIQTAIDSTEGKKEFRHLANSLLEAKQAATYNQAIMDFGATQCTSSNPKCKSCPLHISCLGYQKKMTDRLPYKLKKIKKRLRYFNYLVFKSKDALLLHKRTRKDIWNHLHEFPLIESSSLLNQQELIENEIFSQLLDSETSFELLRASKPYQQVLTHQKIIAVFWEFSLHSLPIHNDFGFFEVKQKNINNFAFPKIIDWYLKDKSLYLKLF